MVKNGEEVTGKEMRKITEPRLFRAVLSNIIII